MMDKKNSSIEIIAVGSELLTPYFQDTDSLYLTQRLNDIGLRVSFKTVVGDDWQDLLLCLRQALERSDLIFVIGGLGPTEDDKTREVLAEVLERKLIFQEPILKKIQERFHRRGLSMPDPNIKQAYLIEGAEALDNKHGTAPGIWVEEGEKKIVLLPGPPHELQPMFEESVWPKLQSLGERFSRRKVVKIAGLTESEMESRIKGLYPKGPDLQITILAIPGQLEIHLHSFGASPESAEKNLEELEAKILEKLGENVFSTSGEELEEAVGKLLLKKKMTLATAESCTGGLLGHRLTNVPGSSGYFLGGVVAYSNEIKSQTLGVPEELLQKYGAVSAEVAHAMASGIKESLKADFGLAITGIAGPSGGTKEKPVGLVYTALASHQGIQVEKNIFLGKREQIKFQSSQKALNMLRLFLLRG